MNVFQTLHRCDGDECENDFGNHVEKHNRGKYLRSSTCRSMATVCYCIYDQCVGEYRSSVLECSSSVRYLYDILVM